MPVLAESAVQIMVLVPLPRLNRSLAETCDDHPVGEAIASIPASVKKGRANWLMRVCSPYQVSASQVR
jgi:hypothetical protein